MTFTPYGADNWFRIPRKELPDSLITKFEHSQGEFSVFSDLSFERHINKLRQGFNWISEGLWYGKSC